MLRCAITIIILSLTLFAALNDAELEEELRFIHKNSLNPFARPICRIFHPKLDLHTHRNDAFETQPHTDTINLMLYIGVNIIQ
jgi:hypothetical protein